MARLPCTDVVLRLWHAAAWSPGICSAPIEAAGRHSNAAATASADSPPAVHTQDAEGKEREKAERLRFGRFFYRCASSARRAASACVGWAHTVDTQRRCRARSLAATLPSRFPNGESGADVYDRITVFTDHLIRDMNAGRFGANNTSLVLVTHGLALRIFLMR